MGDGLSYIPPIIGRIQVETLSRVQFHAEKRDQQKGNSHSQPDGEEVAQEDTVELHEEVGAVAENEQLTHIPHTPGILLQPDGTGTKIPEISLDLSA